MRTPFLGGTMMPWWRCRTSWVAVCALFGLWVDQTGGVRRWHESTAEKPQGRRVLQSLPAEGGPYRLPIRRELAVDPSSADEHLIQELPGLPGDFKTRQWAGLLTVDEANTGRLFYWLFEAATDADKKPLLIWLNGGPGCSSMDGLFLENGPIKVDDSMNLQTNDNGWHNVANVLYVDQPVGTGFSYVGNSAYCNNDECINDHFYKFLQSFFKLHSWLQAEPGATTRPVYFSGESQAGHYIPSMVSHILDQNTALEASKGKSGKLMIDVKGMAIGNGWIDPPTQYDVSDLAHGVGLISRGQYLTLQSRRQQCAAALHNGQYNVPVCFTLLDDVLFASGTPNHNYVSLYDYTLYDDPNGREYPPGHKSVETYMNKLTVKQALHAIESPLRFQECTDPPYDHLKHQDGKGVLKEIAHVLDSGKVRVLFFNGARDVICNHLGNEAALRNIKWSGSAAFESAKRSIWLPESQTDPAGYVKSYGQLSYLVVLNAGHMVPLSEPEASLDMITRFVEGASFSDASQGIDMTADGKSAENFSCAPVPAKPTLKNAQAESDGSVVLQYEPVNAGGSKVWYTVLVNPGGTLLTPSATSHGNGLIVNGLGEGVRYTLQLLASSTSGVSEPSAPVEVTVGCGAGGSLTCGHGTCVYDVEAHSKRCLCFKGYDGEGCDKVSVTSSSVETTGEATATVPTGARRGRVTYDVDDACKSGDGFPGGCALRFTVMAKVRMVEGPEEVHAMESLLTRDLQHALGLRSDSVVMRSLHSDNASDGKTVDAPVNSKQSSDNGASRYPLACTFDVLNVVDAAGAVDAFRKMWGVSESPLSSGIVTANFDQTGDARVLLVPRDTPLQAAKPGATEFIKPEHRSLAMALVACGAIVVLLVVVMRVSKRVYRRDGRWNRRSRGQVPSGDVDRPGPVEDGVEVEVMEIRTAGQKAGSIGGRSLGLGLSLPGQTNGRPQGREDEGSSERLV